MKKYLILGLILLIGSNLILIGGAVLNRMGEPSAQLTLSERELKLPYSSRSDFEDSGIFLSIKWRIPKQQDEQYIGYYDRSIDVSEQKFRALGFDLNEPSDDIYWSPSKEPRTLFWALEYNGDLYQARKARTQERYELAAAAFETHPTEEHSKDKEQSAYWLSQEKNKSSRLFFVEIAADYQTLVTKYASNPKIIVLAGLTVPGYYSDENKYSLYLSKLTVGEMMVPAKFTQHFNRSNDDDSDYRYNVDVAWGSRLEPWIVGVNTATKTISIVGRNKH